MRSRLDRPHHDLAHPGDRRGGSGKHRYGAARWSLRALSSAICEPVNSAEWVTRANNKVQQIDEEEHDGDRDAESAKSRRGRVRRGLKGRGKYQCDRRERQHRRLRPRACRIEVLLGTAQSSAQHGGAQHQQDIADDGAGDRGFHHVVEPGAQCGERNDELGGIAESRVEKPADTFAETLRELLRGPAHPPGQRQDGEAGGHENKEITLGSEISKPMVIGTKSRSQFIAHTPPRSCGGRLVRPIRPIHRVALQVTVGRSPDGRKKETFADPCEQSETLELVLHGILELGEAQLDAGFAQRLVQFGEHVGGGDVHAGHRLRRDDQPAHGRRRSRDGLENALLEQLGVGEEQRRVPAEQHQTGICRASRIALDVVVALDAFGASQHRGMRAPAIPQELDDRDHDRKADAGDGAENRDADEADDGQPEFPVLDAENAHRDR